MDFTQLTLMKSISPLVHQHGLQRILTSNIYNSILCWMQRIIY